MQIKILALSGSQRLNSWSTSLLVATAALAPEDISVQIYENHKQFPLFNSDHEIDPPIAVRELRNLVTAADAVLIASPEYAHGVTGTIKNTLDWLVSHPGFAGKPVAVFNPAYQSHHADLALKETLRVMAADLVPGACLRIPVIGSGIDQSAIKDHPEFHVAITEALHAIAHHVLQRKRQAGDTTSTSCPPHA